MVRPDVQDLTRTLYNEHQYKHFIYTPVGFVCEHLEVLYDNDYECKVVCDEIGANYYRPTMPNTNPLFINAIVDEIKQFLIKEGLNVSKKLQLLVQE